MYLSGGKSYEWVKNLKQETNHATYLLRGLQAETKLCEDYNLVGDLLRKLPTELGSE